LIRILHLVGWEKTSLGESGYARSQQRLEYAAKFPLNFKSSGFADTKKRNFALKIRTNLLNDEFALRLVVKLSKRTKNWAI
jgi:hypothetical protein